MGQRVCLTGVREGMNGTWASLVSFLWVHRGWGRGARRLCVVVYLMRAWFPFRGREKRVTR